IDGFKISISYDYIMVEDTEAEFEGDGLWEYYYEDANKEIRRMSDIAFECELSKPLDVIKQWLECNILGTTLIK
ncbi:MAG: hypothetical protein II685_05750, partial [Clostridia bacterium]|nr:hypothetical protein [Clostridia bacterium]